MATHPQLDLQRKIYSTLRGDATLLAMLEQDGLGIYDNAPENTSYPYVTIGDDSLGDFGSHDTNGVEGDVTIHVWSQARGRHEAKEIMNRIFTLLHGLDLALTGYPTITFRCSLNEVLVDPDGRTHHGVQRYRIILGG